MRLTNIMMKTRVGGAASKGLRLSAALLMILTLSHCAQFSGQDNAAAKTPTIIEQQQADTKPAAQPQTAEQAAATDSAMPPVRPMPQLSAVFQAQFQQAKQLMRKEDYQAALTLLEPLAQSLPDAAGIHYNLALCYWQLQQSEPARQQLTALLERQPEYVEAANLLGVIARQAGNFNQARRYWLDALAQQEDFASAHKNLGFLYELYLAQPEQARYHYLQYQQLTADPMAEAWLSLLEQQE